MVLGKGKLVRSSGELDGVLRLKDLVEFLELSTVSLCHCKKSIDQGTYRALPGLGEDEVCNDTLESTPDNEDDVCLPFDLLERNGPSELVHEAGGIDREGLQSHTLGSDFEAETLDGIQRLQRSDVEGVDGAEDEDEREHGIACIVVAVDRVAIFGASGDQGGRESACGSGHANPDNCGAEKATQHHLATADLLNEVSSNDSPEELEAGVSKVDIGLADRSVDTGGVEDGGHEVGENRVSAPLREGREPTRSHGSVEVRPLVEDWAIVPPALVLCTR